MNIKVYIGRDEKLCNLISLTEELEPWVIDYEFDSRNWCFNILTTPCNESMVNRIFNKYISVKQRV